MTSEATMKKCGRIIIEISGVCQAKCPYCAQKRLKQQKAYGSFMPVDLFKKIVEHYRGEGFFDNDNIDRVYLYNWGEPFLNPYINEYLKVLRESGLYAVLSSNFIKKPILDEENLPVINEVIFSLSGMSQQTYGRIHGASIENVLENFEEFYLRLKHKSPGSRVFISWHRYLFNEGEFWRAYEYSRAKGIGFIPSIAFLNDHSELFQLAGNRLPAERKKRIEADVFIGHISQTIAGYKKGGMDFNCPAWDDVVIDEQGQLLICCGSTGYDEGHVLGNVFAVSYGQMRQKKTTSYVCLQCRSLGIAEWAHNNHHDYNQLPWPSGGGIRYWQLKLSYNSLKLKNDTRYLLNNFMFGRIFLNTFRKIRKGRKIK